MRLTPIWACLIPAMALSEPAWADGLPGQTLAQDYCSACHRVSAEQAPPPKVTVNTGVGSEEYEAPSFRQIAARPGRDAAYLRTFIKAPHYPMREQRFIPDELEQIVTYILSLKGTASAEW
jgi:mono/diheme cytochrome c family protein